MAQNTYAKLLLINRCSRYSSFCRRISKYIHKDISSKNIRQQFLDYFIKEKNHAFVKSSPVVPFCDSTVPFVNAGMNQFKGIFLGTQVPHFMKVANSQKCIRIGGKHNDLNIVGKDGYHHTFFEMMGNWSFGSYFKKEACEMAWELLTKVYKIPPNRLYVTYFGGDNKLNIGPDFETKDIWKSIGLLDNRILPFGIKDNFWEMGPSGPCGPCSEIHFDHICDTNRGNLVNKGLHDLTEIWNLVFIEYNRCADGSIEALPKKHIDTGLGLERLTCALQGKLSSYDTDLFDYLITAIHKNCNNIPKYSGKFGEEDWNNIDTSYRILSDHIRMIVASLADGIIPEENQKLRRVLRRCFSLSQNVFFKESGFVKELSNYVVEHMGEVYPEMEQNIKQIHSIIDFEEDVYKLLKEAAEKELKKISFSNKFRENTDFVDFTPSFILAMKELQNTQPNEITGDLAFRLYDTYGLDSDSIQQLSEILSLSYNPENLVIKMNKVRAKSREEHHIQFNKIFDSLNGDLNKTDDTEKYSYRRNESGYIFPELSAKVLKIIDNDQFISKAHGGSSCSVILDKTNFYCEAGGQQSDRGALIFKNGALRIESVLNINDYIVHRGYIEGEDVILGSECKVVVDRNSRLSCMQNHTSTHLLNAAVKKIKNAICQKSSKVTDRYLNLDVAIFGTKLTINDIKQIDDIIQKIIKKKIDVQVNITDSQGLYSYKNITLIPGEVYPDQNIRIIEIDDGDNFIAREPCCGTHILNTGDIEDFCIVSMKSLGRSTVSLHAVTGTRAKLARQNAQELYDDINVFKKTLSDNLDKPDVLDMAVYSLKQRLKFDINDQSILPLVAKSEILDELNSISKRIKDTGKDNLKNFIDLEMQEALKTGIALTKTNKKYMVHYLRSSTMLESAPLQRATKVCPDIPVLIIAYSDNMVKARCCVPKEFSNEKFNAEKWMKSTVASVFNSKVSAPKGQDGALVCNMKARKVHAQHWDTLLSESLQIATEFVNDNL
ncbi:alanine--tRNA ligase, mitochondrial isoform X1 [Rhynchophorus ferrugineus]|uniref:alanine--tRNA ligase, mitochondrial isoform X1 n=2 Tax=Rhynchophorus ferrugineus TaxID=354439 RepID=UPI003FCE961A